MIQYSSLPRQSSAGPSFKTVFACLLFITLILLLFYYELLGEPSPYSGFDAVPISCSKNWSLLKAPTRPFKILFWTRWYGFYPDDSKDFRKAECESEFMITSNKSECVDADVIVFQFVDLYKEAKKSKLQLPPSRDANVPWILSLQEASVFYPLEMDTAEMNNIETKRSRGSSEMLKEFDNIFNWTWSFRSDSLIHPNFTEMFEKYEEPGARWVYGSEFSKAFLSEKKMTAAWVVSNCKMQLSGRNELVSNLMKLGIEVDIFGKCGNHTQMCKKGDDCFKTLGKSYKFYLALENALCEDYITEKIYHGLLHGMVPIVYALGNVQINAPEDSFINVLDYPKISDLVDRIKYLDKNEKEYFKYFEWRKYFNVNVTGSSKYNCYVWIKMKEFTMKLHTKEGKNYRHVYGYFRDWYQYFYNTKMGKRCKICLNSKEVNATHLYLNRDVIYNNSSRCKE